MNAFSAKLYSVIACRYIHVLYNQILLEMCVVTHCIYNAFQQALKASACFNTIKKRGRRKAGVIEIKSLRPL